MRNIRIEIRDKHDGELVAYRKTAQFVSEKKRKELARDAVKYLPKTLDNYYAVELNCEFDEVVDVNRQYDIIKRRK